MLLVNEDCKVNLALRDLKVQLVLKVFRDRPDQKVQVVQQVILALKVQQELRQARRDQRVTLENQARRDQQEPRLGLKDLKVIQVNLAHRVRRVDRVQLDQMVFRVFKVLKDNKV